MKKILLLTALALGALAVSAQSVGGGRSSGGNSFFSTEKADKGVTIGIRGGLNVAGLSTAPEKGLEDYYISSKLGIGYNAGINIDIPIIKSMYIQTGLYWTVKTAKMENSYRREYRTYKFNPSFIEIPLLASYRYDLANKMQLQVNLGPYFAYGVAGKFKYGSDNENLFKDTKDEGYKFPKYLNPFDAGIKIGAGITINHFFVGISYEKGFSNLAYKKLERSYTDDPFAYRWDIQSIKTHNFSVNVGYDF